MSHHQSGIERTRARDRPRLLVVTSTYSRWAGDPEPGFVHELSKRLVGRFHVAVLCPHSPGAVEREVLDGVEVIRYRYAPAALETLVYGGGLMGNLRASPWKVLLLPSFIGCWLWKAAQLERKRDVDVVHAHWFVPGAIVAMLGLRGTPKCVTAHGTDVLGLKSAWWRRFRKFIAARASAVTVVGKRIQEVLDEEGILGSRVLPMGVDLTNLFVPATHRGQGSRFIFVGRLMAAKRPDVVLHAFACVSRVHPELGLDLVGDGPDQRKLESLAEELGVRHKVAFHGRKRQAEIVRLYHTALAAVVASGGDDAPEGLGLVAIEALGSGCPVVSVPNVALQSALPAEAPIRYASDSSLEALTDALLDVVTSPSVAPTLNPTWRDDLVQRFDWKRVANEYGRLLDSLVEAGKT